MCTNALSDNEMEPGGSLINCRRRNHVVDPPLKAPSEYSR
jgi:hypothetical protein